MKKRQKKKNQKTTERKMLHAITGKKHQKKTKIYKHVLTIKKIRVPVPGFEVYND